MSGPGSIFSSMGSIFGGRGQPQPKDAAPQPAAHKAHIIVLGNEKGGSGKTTTGMHIMVSLMRLGFTVGSMDIDARQRSLSRYLDNRRKTAERQNVALPMPQHIIITKSPFNVMEEAEDDERDRFMQGMSRLAASDFIMIDSPGNDTFLSRLAHSYADTIITPINDSFVDLDVLASVDGETMQIIRPSIYSEMVWEQKLARAKRDGGSIEWVVMRNRLSHLDAKNKRFMKKVTEDLSRRIGFRIAPGFSERVIYREMFLQGLTVLDVIDMSNNSSISISHVAAKQEVRDLLKTLRIPEIDRRINELRTREEQPEISAADVPDDVAPPVAKAPPAPAPVSKPAAEPVVAAKPAAPVAAQPVAPVKPAAPSPAAMGPVGPVAPMSPVTAPVSTAAMPAAAPATTPVKPTALTASEPVLSKTVSPAPADATVSPKFTVSVSPAVPATPVAPVTAAKPAAPAAASEPAVPAPKPAASFPVSEPAAVTAKPVAPAASEPVMTRASAPAVTSPAAPAPQPAMKAEQPDPARTKVEPTPAPSIPPAVSTLAEKLDIVDSFDYTAALSKKKEAV